jgi:hypothetical protein
MLFVFCSMILESHQNVTVVCFNADYQAMAEKSKGQKGQMSSSRFGIDALN